MVTTLRLDEKGVSPDEATPATPGWARNCAMKLSRALAAMPPAAMTRVLSWRKPRAWLRAKLIWANTTKVAMASAMETVNCSTTSTVRSLPEPACPDWLLRRTDMGRKPDSSSAG